MLSEGAVKVSCVYNQKASAIYIIYNINYITGLHNIYCIVQYITWAYLENVGMMEQT